MSSAAESVGTEGTTFSDVSVNMQLSSTEAACDNINEKITQLLATQSECSIYRVHNDLRNVCDKAYEPNIIAIGPYHRNKGNLQLMEEQKLRYLHLLLNDTERETPEIFVSAIRQLYPEAKKRYAQPINLSETEFIEMMVLDGCFIIELVRKFDAEQRRDRNDAIFQMEWINSSLQRDLMLFENQIPFSILSTLFNLIEGPDRNDRLIYLLLNFFRTLYPESGYRVHMDGNPEIKHLLHLIHNNWLPRVPPNGAVNIGFLNENQNQNKSQSIQSAAKLAEANVTFNRSDSDTLFEINFENGIMSLPPLTIDERTEDFFRNLIAYEQYYENPEASFVRDYVNFMDCLIDSSRDVGILRRRDIINSSLGDDEMLADMFNNLMKSVIGPGRHYRYAEIFQKVNIHYSNPKNWWMNMLRRQHLYSPWKIISLCVAVLLILLTITQTVFSGMQAL